MAVSFRKVLDLVILSVFMDLEGKLVVLDFSDNEGSVFRLVAVYTPTGAGQPKFFRHLETFLGTFRSLELTGDRTAILDACVHWVGLVDRKGVRKPQTCTVVSS